MWYNPARPKKNNNNNNNKKNYYGVAWYIQPGQNNNNKQRKIVIVVLRDTIQPGHALSARRDSIIAFTWKRFLGDSAKVLGISKKETLDIRERIIARRPCWLIQNAFWLGIWKWMVTMYNYLMGTSASISETNPIFWKFCTGRSQP